MDLSVSMHLSATFYFNHCYLLFILVIQLLLRFFSKVHVASFGIHRHITDIQ